MDGFHGMSTHLGHVMLKETMPKNLLRKCVNLLLSVYPNLDIDLKYISLSK